MKPMRYLIAVALLASGCAYHAPDAPTAQPAVSSSAPAFVTLGAAVGTGIDAGKATVTAKVQNASGVPLASVPVAFRTDIGTVAPDIAMTGENGVAITFVSASSVASVTARAGTVTSQMLVMSNPAIVAPTPTPDPQPAPSVPLGPLAIAITAGTNQAGIQIPFSVDIMNSSGAFSIAWDYGDGLGSRSTSTTTTHTYASGGTYRATAVISDAGRTASATVSVVVRN